MAREYSTDHFKPAERFEFWRDVICDAYLPISCETPCTDSFRGRIELDRLSKLDVSRVSGSPQRVTRRKEQISRGADSYFMLSLQLSDVSKISQSGRSVVLHAGDMGLYNTSEPYEILCRSEVDQLIVQMPEDALLQRLPDADMLVGLGLTAQSQMGALVSAQMQQCAASLRGQSPLVQQHLQDVMLDLVAAGFSSLTEGRLELSRPEQLTLRRAKSTIHAHLRDEELNPAFLANAMGMSPRNLGRVFQREGTSIAATIRKLRLEAIASDLVDPRMVSFSISQIACKWGFSNFQHFSKLFKDTYGAAPRDYRRENRRLQ